MYVNTYIQVECYTNKHTNVARIARLYIDQFVRRERYNNEDQLFFGISTSGGWIFPVICGRERHWSWWTVKLKRLFRICLAADVSLLSSAHSRHEGSLRKRHVVSHTLQGGGDGKMEPDKTFFFWQPILDFFCDAQVQVFIALTQV